MSERKIIEATQLVLPGKELYIPESGVLQVCGSPEHAIQVQAKSEFQTLMKAGTPSVAATGFDAGDDDDNPTFFKISPDRAGLEIVGCDVMQIKPAVDGILEIRGGMAISDPEDRVNWDIGKEMFEMAGIIDFTGERIRLLVKGQVVAEYLPK